MKAFPKRKLTEADGEYILWHVLEHLQCERTVYGIESARGSVRHILESITGFYPTSTPKKIEAAQ